MDFVNLITGEVTIKEADLYTNHILKINQEQQNELLEVA
jgi:hypothetical protein